MFGGTSSLKETREPFQSIVFQTLQAGLFRPRENPLVGWSELTLPTKSTCNLLNLANIPLGGRLEGAPCRSCRAVSRRFYWGGARKERSAPAILPNELPYDAIEYLDYEDGLAVYESLGEDAAKILNAVVSEMPFVLNVSVSRVPVPCQRACFRATVNARHRAGSTLGPQRAGFEDKFEFSESYQLTIDFAGDLTADKAGVSGP